jgi:hypothetical protein
MTVEPTRNGGSRYTQTVTFRPRGLAGRVYWYAQRPGHDLVFGVMARMIAFEAERRAPRPAAPNGAVRVAGTV